METNELTLPYASLGRRILAFLLDGLILIIPCAIVNSMIPVVGGLIVWFFYAPILESSEIKATLGKQLLGIQVVDLSGRRLTLRAATLRNILKFISSVLVFIGFFFAFFSKKKQTLHDLLAETVVVYGRSERPISDSWMESLRDLFKINSAKPEMSSESSTLTQLERLQALREKGALTEEEFQKEKQKILI